MFGFARRDRSGDLLDSGLWKWSTGDWYRFRDLCNGGVLCLGRAGSGKTSSVLDFISMCIIAHARCGGFILAASPSDVTQWQERFARVGMANKLIVFDESQPFRFNCLDFILKNGGSTRDVVKTLANISEILGNSQGGGEDGQRFFIQAENRLLWSAIEICKRAGGGTLTASDLQKFILTAAQSVEQLHSPEWEEKSFHAQTMAIADAQPKTPIEQHDYQLAETYFLDEYPAISSKTRSGILAGVMNTLFTFNTGWVRELLATTSNISPKVFDDGYFVLVNTPISRMGEEGAFILGTWKYLSQWHALRRSPDADNAILVGIIDEMQNTVSSQDASYLSESRKYRGATIALSQGISNFFANVRGEHGTASVNALMTNFSHKILMALGDPETASWASSLIGNSWRTTHTLGEKGEQDMFDAVFGLNAFHASFSESLQPTLEPAEFMHGLRTGGKHNGYLCDSIVIKSGESFANGANWLRVSWSQKN